MGSLHGAFYSKERLYDYRGKETGVKLECACPVCGTKRSVTVNSESSLVLLDAQEQLSSWAEEHQARMHTEAA